MYKCQEEIQLAGLWHGQLIRPLLSNQRHCRLSQGYIFPDVHLAFYNVSHWDN